MNNRVQQRFDKSIREAVEDVRRIKAREDAARPTREPLPPMSTTEKRAAKATRKGYVLSLDPLTGATVWGPK